MSQQPKSRKSNNDFGPVGFGSPPKATQFKKGTSGNPKGRPRKITPEHLDSDNAIEQALQRVLSEHVNVVQNGKKKKLSKLDSIFKSLEKQVFAGRPYAAKLLLDYAGELEQKKTAAYEKDLEFWQGMNAAREKYLEHCRKRDLPVKGFWLQDEDIIVRKGKPLWIRGPATEEDIPFYERFKWMRNLLAVDQVLRIVTSDPKPVLPTLDNIMIFRIGQYLSAQQCLESNAYAEMVWDNVYSQRWLRRERDRVATYLFGKPPTTCLPWPEVSEKELRKLGITEEMILRARITRASK